MEGLMDTGGEPKVAERTSGVDLRADFILFNTSRYAMANGIYLGERRRAGELLTEPTTSTIGWSLGQ